MEHDLHLEQSFESIDTVDFLSVLKCELEASDILPLEDFCERGGWPDEDTLEINVLEISRSKEVVRVKATVCFGELISTGCADINQRHVVVADVEIKFDRKTRSAYIV